MVYRRHDFKPNNQVEVVLYKLEGQARLDQASREEYGHAMAVLQTCAGALTLSIA